MGYRTESLKDERRRKKLKAKSTAPPAPPAMQVIDVPNDAPVSSNTTSHTTTNATSTPVTATLNPPPTIPASSPHQESSTLTTSTVSTFHVSCSPSHPSQVATPAIPAQLVPRTDACGTPAPSALPSANTAKPSLSSFSPADDVSPIQTDPAVGDTTTTSLNPMQDDPNVVMANEHGQRSRRSQVTFSTNLNFRLLIFDIFR
jgi:hypothetical protein